jgi:hypothetical protein
MRSGAIPRLIVLLGFVLAVSSCAGCAERDPLTTNDVAARPACACGATVTTLAAPVEPVVAAAPRPVRLQETVSLGYAGDGRLTQIETRRDWWGDRDRAGYGGYGYGYGGRGRSPGATSSGPQVSAVQAGFSSPFQQGMGTRGGGHAAQAAPAAPASHGPR